MSDLKLYQLKFISIAALFLSLSVAFGLAKA